MVFVILSGFLSGRCYAQVKNASLPLVMWHGMGRYAVYGVVSYAVAEAVCKSGSVRKYLYLYLCLYCSYPVVEAIRVYTCFGKGKTTSSMDRSSLCVCVSAARVYCQYIEGRLPAPSF